MHFRKESLYKFRLAEIRALSSATPVQRSNFIVLAKNDPVNRSRKRPVPTKYIRSLEKDLNRG